MVTGRDVRELLDERPDLEPVLEDVLATEGPFSFEDVDADSGTFGELVSTDLVTQAEAGGYRLVDEAAVRAGLSGDIDPDSQRSLAETLASRLSWDGIDRFSLGLLLAGLVLVVGLRVVSWPTVFRQGHVVLSSNDPYYYRYLVEQLATTPDGTPSTLPGNASKGEPLLVVSLWLLSAALGGSQAAIGQVLAWYPVGSALITALIVYALASRASDDRRVALAAVVMLAILPGHAMRTSLGFADHHAFDYVWLAITLLGIVLVVRDEPDSSHITSRSLGATALVALGITGQTLAWEAGPLLIVPVGGYVAVDALRALDQETSPLPTSGPVAAGAVVAATLTWTAHETLNWHTTLVASAPALLAAGCVGVLGAGYLAYRLDAPVAALAGVEAVGFLAGVLALRTLQPEMWIRIQRDLSGRLFRGDAIAETQSLFGQSFGWLLLFGFVLVLALPYLFIGARWARDRGAWVALLVYGWYFLVLAAIQVRFVGQLSLVIAVLAGVGFVHLAAWVDVIDPPTLLGGPAKPALSRPDSETLRNLALVFLLVSSLSLVQIPIKVNQLTISDAEWESTTAMADHSEAQNLTYPDNYVFSQWGRNRLYNYFVSGQSLSYGYAQSNYDRFVRSTAPDTWSQRLTNRGGYVVTTDAVVTNDSALGTRLHASHGSRSESVPGLAHYRLIEIAGDGSHKVFSVVPGAVIRGTGPPNGTVTVATEVTVDDRRFTYRRRAETNAEGVFTVRVPYPGPYEYGSRSVTVTEAAVRNGTTITGSNT